MRIRKLLTVVSLVLASLAAAVTLAGPASASVAASSHDTAACTAVYHFHHVNAVPALYGDEALWQSAYRAAMGAAWKASPGVGGVIVHYLREGDDWSWVRKACR